MMPENVEQLNDTLARFAKEVRYAIDTHDYELAKDILLTKVLKAAPNHPIALDDLAFVESKLNNHDVAYGHLMTALRYSVPNTPSEIYDSLAGVCAKMHRYEESRYYGRLSIRTKKIEVEKLNPQKMVIPNIIPPGLSSDKSKNIISYSLFGCLPRYCETAVINTQLAKEIYPEWTCRFYIDETVPAEIVSRLRNNGAQVIYVDEEQRKISGLFWRFYVFDDENVQCFVIRDADSLLSYKEKAAVDEWLKSGKWFHIMRDAYNHSELILAGMWGGYRGGLQNMQDIVKEHFAQIKVFNKTIDQVFLRQIIWPTVQQSVLVHDNFMLDPESKVYPEYSLSDLEKIPYFHIGMIDSGIKTTRFFIEHDDVRKVRWFLKDEQDKEVCSYVSDVEKDEKTGESVIVLNLPYQYSMQINEGKWHFTFTILEK